MATIRGLEVKIAKLQKQIAGHRLDIAKLKACRCQSDHSEEIRSHQESIEYLQEQIEETRG